MKNEICEILDWFDKQELSISSVNSLKDELRLIAERYDDGYKSLLSQCDTVGKEERLSYTKPEVENMLNQTLQVFNVGFPCSHCNGTGRLQCPSPTNNGDYTEEHCPYCNKKEQL